MDNVVYENSLGNQYDNNENEIMDVQMEVDNKMYPIEKVTNFDIYINLKPSEKEAKERNNSSAEKPQMNDKKSSYKHYKDVEKEQLFFLVEEKGMSVRAAAQKLINVRSAQGWVSKNNKDPPEYIQRSSDSGKPVGRPPVLTDEHNNYMIQWADENTDSVVLEDVLDALTEKFGYLQITRNKAAFHINFKRNLSWSKEGNRTVIKVLRTRTKTTIILGAISPFGVVNISVRRPRALAPSKKRKVNRGTKVKESNDGGTVTGYYFNFISSVLDVMDCHERFRGHYLVIDNAPIRTHEDIQKHIESHGYGCVYLPPYSSELNPIGRFWSVYKSKLKENSCWMRKHQRQELQILATESCIATYKDFVDILHPNLTTVSIRLEYRKKRLDCEELQIIEALETAIQNIIFCLNGDKSELECMEGCCSILKTVFRGSKYKFKLGEQACIESKNAREENEKTFGNNQTLDSTRNIMGRRIDLLLSSFETNISSCEWKAENVSPSIARSQESKNIRVNAFILEALLRLPHEKNDDYRSPFVLMYSDWVGRDGCINTIVKEDDAFIVKKLRDVFIPTSLHEIDEHFKLTIKQLYT
ncbi:hypothetical protein G6F37_010262 [Rhizopus arrhizus]|nr:hypothetical protein G6F38_012211 [Rhizopus arrhizus]KAG1153544.1 hypothetical protein G6F37_010262 [Rhizopus arrhizus]